MEEAALRSPGEEDCGQRGQRGTGPEVGVSLAGLRGGRAAVHGAGGAWARRDLGGQGLAGEPSLCRKQRHALPPTPSPAPWCLLRACALDEQAFSRHLWCARLSWALRLSNLISPCNTLAGWPREKDT